MRRRSEHMSGSMDSLLDTMTNVVGILVVLLAVTQLGVSTAVKRIRSNLPEVDDAQLLKARSDADLLEKKASGLQKEWAKLEAQYKKDNSRLAVLNEKVDPAKAAIHADLLKMLELLADQSDKGNNKKIELQAAIEKLTEELKKVRKDLAELDKREKPPEKIVRIPNPRPAPKGAGGEWFVCRKGRVSYVNVDGIAESVAKRLSMMKMQLRHGKPGLVKRSAKTPAKKEIFEYDRAKLMQYFEKNRIVVDNHRVAVYGRGYHPACWMSLEFNMKMAEDEKAIQRPWAKLRKALERVRQKKNYAKFIVYPDSFEIYLKAREIADSMKVPAGWQVSTSKVMPTWKVLPDIRLNKTEDAPPPSPPPKPGVKKVVRPRNVLD